MIYSVINTFLTSHVAAPAVVLVYLKAKYKVPEVYDDRSISPELTKVQLLPDEYVGMVFCVHCVVVTSPV